ncbi:MAG: DUF72 domain-containing protein [Bacteroidota bacterium]
MFRIFSRLYVDMKFGKLSDISGVNFSLPPVNENTLKRLGGASARGKFKAYVGLSRWASKDWLGQLFPPKTKQADYLHFYSQSFNTIELNTTHYRIPKMEQVEKWVDQAAEGFVFCPKIPQTISHYRKMINSDTEIEMFVEAIRLFGDKMGCSFVQMHESFGPSQMENLKDFVRKWPEDVPISFEFRHPDWFEEQQTFPEVLDILSSKGFGMVTTDVSGRRDVLHTDLTNKTAMIRLVGNSLHPTDYNRFDQWLERLALWVDNGLEELYIFPHEPEDPKASDYGKYMIEGLNKEFGLGLTIPGIPDESAGQMSLF